MYREIENVPDGFTDFAKVFADPCAMAIIGRLIDGAANQSDLNTLGWSKSKVSQALADLRIRHLVRATGAGRKQYRLVDRDLTQRAIMAVERLAEEGFSAFATDLYFDRKERAATLHRDEFRAERRSRRSASDDAPPNPEQMA